MAENCELPHGARINTLIEEEGPDRVPVRVGHDCAVLAGHFYPCHVQVEGGALRNAPLRAHVRIQLRTLSGAQVVEVANGAADPGTSRCGTSHSVACRPDVRGVEAARRNESALSAEVYRPV